MSTGDQNARLDWKLRGRNIPNLFSSPCTLSPIWASQPEREKARELGWIWLRKEHENGTIIIGEITWHLTGFSTGEVAPPSKFDKISDSGPGLPRGPRGSLSEGNHWKDRLHQLDSSPGEKFEGWIVAGKCCCWALWPASHLNCSNLSILIYYYRVAFKTR